MTWVKLDDAILDNPKVIRAGPVGFALHVAAITWCARNLTDGFVPQAKAKHLLEHTWTRDFEDGHTEVWQLSATSEHAGLEAPGVIAQTIEGLIDSELWIEGHDSRGNYGFWLKDYLEYNPSRASVLAEREKKIQAGKAGGLKRASLAQANAKQTPSTPPSTPPSKTEAKLNPVPDPVPKEEEEDSSRVASQRAADDGPKQSGSFEIRSSKPVQIPEDWEPPEELIEALAEKHDVEPGRLRRCVREFRWYWLKGKGKGKRRSPANWATTFANRIGQLAKSEELYAGRFAADDSANANGNGAIRWAE